MNLFDVVGFEIKCVLSSLKIVFFFSHKKEKKKKKQSLKLLGVSYHG